MSWCHSLVKPGREGWGRNCFKQRYIHCDLLLNLYKFCNNGTISIVVKEIVKNTIAGRFIWERATSSYVVPGAMQ